MKKILSLVLVLALTVGAMLSLTSCGYAFDIVLDSFFGGDNGQVGSGTGDGGSTNNGQSGDGSGSDGGERPSQNGGNSIYLPDREENAEAAEGLNSQSRALLSTVSITSTFTLRQSGYFSPSSEIAYGSGVFYSVDREAGNAYIITNYHVVYNANGVNGGICDNIKVYLYGQEYEDYAISATFVGGSMNYDIAVLKVENSTVIKNSLAVAAIFGDSETVNVLDDVLVVGNAEGYGMSVTEGIVSVQSEKLSMTGADGYTSVTFRVMRVSAAINNGNSGGGLYGADGKLVGIVNAKRQGANVDNMGYAIPINLAKSVVENILDNCDGALKIYVYKPVVGVKFSSKSVGVVVEGDEIVIKEIVAITEVVDNSLAVGKLAVGDVINSITIDGVTHEVTRTYHFTDSMLDARVGSVVVINVTRGAVTLDVTIDITESCITTVK